MLRCAAAALLLLSARVSAHLLTEETLNQNLVDMQYAVRGEVLDVAMELSEKLKTPGHGLPFDELVRCNIGNPQALGQKPPPFNRQVMSLVTNPDLLDDASSLSSAFLPQARERAAEYIAAIKGGIGAYSNSQGVAHIRQEVADFIERRDGFPSDPAQIFLTNGASDGVKALMQAMIRGGAQRDGVLVPIPQYPLYSALTTLFDGELLGYYLDESQDWNMAMSELERVADEAAQRGVAARGLVVINPGNPTSQQLSRAAMEDVVRFCRDRGLVLLADEVYQENLYGPRRGTFTSFKKVVMSMGEPFASESELVSFHSASKGFVGECGVRGGYFELHNIDPAVRAQLYKLASISLCSNVMGQVAIGLMVNPPTSGAAGAAHAAHRDGILASLETRAERLTASLSKLDGVSIAPLQASLYGFPRIRLPPAAVAAARAEGKEPDLFYCLELLRATGIVTVPGSGFKQKEGEFHFRITILPPLEKFDGVMKRLETFHNGWMAKWKEL
jgi:alanine transaminase